MTFIRWIAWAMLSMFPCSSPSRIAGEYRVVATAISRATPSPSDAADLASVASYESGYDVRAVGRKGEVGAWQLMPPVACESVRRDGANAQRAVDCQAREALRRWKEQAPCGYTGEMGRTWASAEATDCPMARRRMNRATAWVAQHPFEPVATSSPDS